ncbi:PfkB family carbohydrate kinase, partial [Priestia sp. SIMBA_032]
GPALAVIKRGASGSLAFTEGVVTRRPALTVPVVDTVGAGDAFVAGFLRGRLDGAGVADCLELATIAGAFACMGPGDWESMPRTGDLGLLSDDDPVTR